MTHYFLKLDFDFVQADLEYKYLLLVLPISILGFDPIDTKFLCEKLLANYLVQCPSALSFFHINTIYQLAEQFSHLFS